MMMLFEDMNNVPRDDQIAQNNFFKAQMTGQHVRKYTILSGQYRILTGQSQSVDRSLFRAPYRARNVLCIVERCLTRS